MALYKFFVPYVAYGEDLYIIRADSEDEAWEKLERQEDYYDIQSYDPVEGVMQFADARLDYVIPED